MTFNSIISKMTTIHNIEQEIVIIVESAGNEKVNGCYYSTEKSFRGTDIYSKTGNFTNEDNYNAEEYMFE